MPVKYVFIPGVISLCAIGAGSWACALNDLPAQAWIRNPTAWLIGGFAAWLLRRSGSLMLAGFLPIAAVLLASSFFGPEQSGVHRWISLGPISINASMLLLPAAVVSFALFEEKARWPWLVALACMALLVAQPDRSQASAFGIAIIWIALRSNRSSKMKFSVIALTTLLIAVAFIRPDPLKPVPEVEEIIQLAYAVSPALAGIALISLVVFCLVPIWIVRDGAPMRRAMGEALSLYFIVSAAMPFFGAYPVPLVGVGVSSVLGAWLATGALSAACSTTRTAGAAPDFAG